MKHLIIKSEITGCECDVCVYRVLVLFLYFFLLPPSCSHFEFFPNKVKSAFHCSSDNKYLKQIKFELTGIIKHFLISLISQ